MTTSPDRSTGSCPFCGSPTDVSPLAAEFRAERAAVKVADAVASWWYVLVVVLSAAAWATLNLTVAPVEPFPDVMISGLAAGLALLAAAHGPLILLTQRAEARRDRERARATLRAVLATEHSLTDEGVHESSRNDDS